GAGRWTVCSRTVVRSIVPSRATSTPFVLAVPTSTPSTALAVPAMASPSPVVIVPSSRRTKCADPSCHRREGGPGRRRRPCIVHRSAERSCHAATVRRRGTAARPADEEAHRARDPHGPAPAAPCRRRVLPRRAPPRRGGRQGGRLPPHPAHA